jgi:hypothetical protein
LGRRFFLHHGDAYGAGRGESVEKRVAIFLVTVIVVGTETAAAAAVVVPDPSLNIPHYIHP